MQQWPGERTGGGEDPGGMEREEAIVGILYARRIKRKTLL